MGATDVSTLSRMLLLMAMGQTGVTVLNRSPERAIAVRCVMADGGGYESCAGSGGTGGSVSVNVGAVSQGAGQDGGAWNVAGTFWPTTQPVSGSVSVSNLPATQPVSGTVSVNAHGVTQSTGEDGGRAWGIAGTVSVSNFPATQPVSGSVTVSGTVTASGPLTDTQLRAVAVPVSGTFWPGTQPVSGTVAATQGAGEDGGRAWNVAAAVSNFPASQAVTGTFWQTTQPVSGTVSVGNFPATQPVSGTFWQATQPVSGPLTDTQLRASAVPVSGTFFQATQPVSGTVTASGPVTDTQLRASAVPVSLATLPALAVAAAASSTPVGSVSLGNSLGKVNVLKTGTLATSAVTADQVVLTYTVTAGKTFYLCYLSMNVRLTTFAATATNFGLVSLESPAATKLLTRDMAGTGVGDAEFLTFSEPIPIAAGVVVRVVTTPAAATAMTWRVNLGGYEK